MADDLFQDLPSSSVIPPPLAPVLKSALKRPKPSVESQPQGISNHSCKVQFEEAIALKEELEVPSKYRQINENDPFGLDALMPNVSKEDDNSQGKREVAINNQKEEEEDNRIFLKSQREALISCLEIAAKRYKTPWCQTAIDILAKHNVDNVSRFTTRQRDAIGKLWAFDSGIANL